MSISALELSPYLRAGHGHGRHGVLPPSYPGRELRDTFQLRRLVISNWVEKDAGVIPDVFIR
jgi:hypothetical protein